MRSWLVLGLLVVGCFATSSDPLWSHPEEKAYYESLQPEKFNQTYPLLKGVLFDGFGTPDADRDTLLSAPGGLGADCTYTVKSGDSLSAIAVKYPPNTYVTIANANGIKSPYVIYPGQVLRIPNCSSGSGFCCGKYGLWCDGGSLVRCNPNINCQEMERTVCKNGCQSMAFGVPDQCKADSSGGSTTYRLPFTGSYMVTQSWFGAFSHPGYSYDFGLPSGTPVVAARAGTVKFVRDYSGQQGCCASSCNQYGKYVVVNHSDGLATLYLHLSKASVSVGQTVSKGQIVGYSGNTGYSCGAHLHFQLQTQCGGYWCDSKPIYFDGYGQRQLKEGEWVRG